MSQDLRPEKLDAEINDSNHQTLTKIKRMSKLKFVLYSVVFLFSLLVLLVYLLLGTFAGNQFLVQQISKYEPRFNASVSSGNFISGIVVSPISWQDESISISIDEVSLSWDWSCIHNSRVCIERLGSKGLFVQLSETAEVELKEQKNDDSSPFTWPFNFAAHQVSMQDSRLDIYGEKIAWQSLALSIDADNIGELSLAAPNALRLTHDEVFAQLRIKSFFMSQLDIDLRASETEDSHKAAKKVSKPVATIELPDIELPFALLVDAFDLNGLLITKAEAKSPAGKNTLFELKAASLVGEMRGHDVHLGKLSASFDGYVADVYGDIALFESYPIKLFWQLQLNKNEFMPSSHYELTTAGSVSDLVIDLSSKGPLEFKLKAQLQPLTDELPFNAQLNWSNLQWPMLGQKAKAFSLLSKQGVLSLAGNLKKYSYQFSFDIEGSDIPSLDVDSKGKGDLSSLAIHTLNLIAKHGVLPPGFNAVDKSKLTGSSQITSNEAENKPERVSIAGNLSWLKGIRWLGDIEFQHLGLNQFSSALFGTLSGSSSTQFNLGDADWSLSLNNTKVTGKVNDKQVQLLASVSGLMPLTANKQQPYGQWQLKQFDLSSVEHFIKLKGKVDKHLELVGNLNVSALSQLYPPLKGQLSAAINMSGLISNPKLSYQIGGKNLVYNLSSDQSAQVDKSSEPKQVASSMVAEKITIKDLSSQGQVYLFDLLNDKKSAKQAELKLLLGDVKYQDVHLSQSRLRLSGNQYKHQLSLAINGQPLSMNAKLNGVMTKLKWQGDIESAELNTEFGHLLLQQTLSTQFNFKSNDVSVAKHCWIYRQQQLDDQAKRTDEAENELLCIKQLEYGAQRKLELALKNVQLSTLNRYIKDLGRVKGVLNVDATLDWPQGKKPKAHFNAALGPSKLDFLSLTNKDAEIESIHIESINLSSDLDQNTLSLDLGLASSLLGNTQLDLQLRPYVKNRPITGNLQLDNLSLAKFLPFIPVLDKLQGQIKANVDIKGDLASPLLFGSVELLAMSASGAELPLELQQLNAKFNLDKESAQLQAKALTTTNGQQGELDLTGLISWENKPVSAELDLSGHDVVIGTNTLNLQLEPKLHFSLKENAMLLSGDLRVPKGRVKMRELPQGAVSESSDVLIVNKTKIKKSTALPLILDLNIALEDGVEIDAFGLKSNLEGVLNLRQNIRQPLTANGEISVIEGTYIAWGQNLIIKQGQLIFSGALAKPYLNIDAIRDPKLTENGVIAGVRIQGASENPEVAIYSEPAMSQQEAISYLIRGKGLSGGSDTGNDNAIAAMLIGFGLGKGEGIVSSIGDNLGIRDLTIGTKDVANDTMVEVRGHILPGVEVGYGVSLATNLPQITLKYEVFPKFYVEGVSGVESALDLFYEFEL